MIAVIIDICFVCANLVVILLAATFGGKFLKVSVVLGVIHFIRDARTL